MFFQWKLDRRHTLEGNEGEVAGDGWMETLLPGCIAPCWWAWEQQADVWGGGQLHHRSCSPSLTRHLAR